ncbi:hypothetical protein GAY28_18355 [Azospirillum brasilense]|nr:hypothetical protein [Azospirillum brasilense]
MQQPVAQHLGVGDGRRHALAERRLRARQAAEAALPPAKALSAEARSGFCPVLSINGGADRVGRVGSGDRATSGTGSAIGISRSGTPLTTYDAGLGASWAPDLWGRIRRSVESNDANLQASAADLAAARLSAQAQLAPAYIQFPVAYERKALLGPAIAASRRPPGMPPNPPPWGTPHLPPAFPAPAPTVSFPGSPGGPGGRATSRASAARSSGRPGIGV